MLCHDQKTKIRSSQFTLIISVISVLLRRIVVDILLVKVAFKTERVRFWDADFICEDFDSIERI